MTGEKIYIDVNPRDETPHFLGLVVERPTGVVYSNQSGGLACIWRSLEGYLAILGSGSVPESYMDFFKRFDGRPPSSGTDWSRDDIAELSTLISRTARHLTTDASGYSEVETIAILDPGRIDELTEGWIPVLVDGARGALTFPNSD